MHVGIVGAGISGLSAALLLIREGHKVTIFEASARLGGRIHTHRFRPTSRNGSDVYFEAGAMRIPRSSLHDSVYALIQYLNNHNSSEMKVNLIPYVLEHKNNKAFIKGRKFDRLILTILLGEKSWIFLRNFDIGFQKLLKYDEYSFRRYLRAEGWPHEVIEYVELMNSQTNQYDLSFTELIMQNLDFNTKEWCTVRGGMSNLVEACASLIGRSNIHLNSPVQGISEKGNRKVELRISGPSEYSCTFDKVLLAIPTAAMYTIWQRPTWSFMKEQSLRGAWFEPLYKMGLHFRTRFWEHIPEPCFGGQSVTDLRFRWIVYPSDNLCHDGSGVLLLYCWMSDALKWGAHSREDRVKLCLHDLAKYFADEEVDVHGQFIEAFDKLWSNEYCGGDATFLPGQFSRFYEVAKKPEGNIHFAVESSGCNNRRSLSQQPHIEDWENIGDGGGIGDGLQVHADPGAGAGAGVNLHECCPPLHPPHPPPYRTSVNYAVEMLRAISHIFAFLASWTCTHMDMDMDISQNLGLGSARRITGILIIRD
ncbi:hypothetical protein BKA65DRAFT_593892 [Rhexocercosporidium sp. MPI-PUGE-AT-0058]|nr:hypothetical protein BKA65DRAFT_593892 [Rhexocercosporidium sp. MPI-PUGE-AT-0058]